MYYGRLSREDVEGMARAERVWWVERTIKAIEAEAEALKGKKE